MITDKDRTLAALLGASPGASTCVHIVLEVVQKCFPKLLTGSAMAETMMPAISEDITSPTAAEMYAEFFRQTEKHLQLRSRKN